MDKKTQNATILDMIQYDWNPHLFVTIEKRIIAVRVTWSMTTAHNVLSIELPRKIAETGFEPVTSGA